MLFVLDDLGVPLTNGNQPASTFLYHFNNSYADSKGVGGNFTPNGGTGFGAAKFGAASIEFDGSTPGGAYLQGTSETDATVAGFYPAWVNPFTIDFWVRIDEFPADGVRAGIINTGRTGLLARSYNLDLVGSSDAVSFEDQYGSYSFPWSEITLGEWNHVAFVNAGFGLGDGNFKWCWNGEVKGTHLSNNTADKFGRWDASNNGLRIGYNDFGKSNSVLIGAIDEVRCVVGTAAWSSFPFAVPQKEYTGNVETA